MEPILTLPYSEWLVAEQLMKALPASQGYSVYAPLSRQEKGVDLLLARRSNGVTRAVTDECLRVVATVGHRSIGEQGGAARSHRAGSATPDCADPLASVVKPV